MKRTGKNCTLKKKFKGYHKLLLFFLYFCIIFDFRVSFESTWIPRHSYSDIPA